jgi:riboflavin synthase
MFTGLVEELGRIRKIVSTARSVRLTVSAKKVLSDVKVGDSIAVNGACLTVVDYGDSYFTADVMPETVSQTGLKDLKTGSAVNLERTLKVGDRLGGHIVSGHIDGIGTIRDVVQDDIAVLLTIESTPDVLKYIVRKGSIAIDGISLTVVDCTASQFRVSLIPHTYDVTALSDKRPGNLVNLETDILGRYVEKLLLGSAGQPVQATALGGISTDFLGENGFL